MANLSERLSRALEDISASPDVSDESFSALADAKSALDRLTVEGLAGLTARWHGGPGAPILPEDRRFAQAILDLITTPSVEESHD